MDWLTATLLSTFLIGIVTVFDRKLIADFFPTVASFNVVFAGAQFIMAPIVLAAALPLEGPPDASGAAIALVSGLFWAAGLLFFFHGLRLEEASRATPIYMTFPIFAAILAVIFLGESLNAVQWVGIFVVVVGAGAVSFQPSPGRKGFINPKAFVVLMAASVITAGALVLNKEAADSLGIWTLQGLRTLGMGVGMVALSVRPRHAAHVRQALSNPRAVWLFVTTELVLAPVAVLMLNLALARGSASLVSAVFAARPIVVLAVSAGLSTRYWNVLNERLDRSTLAVKAVSAFLVVAGVAVLSVA